MILKKAGFFKELSYGEEDGISLKESINNDEDKEKDNIIKYLESGVIFIMSPGITEDFFIPGKVIGAGPNILTDGLWVWPSDLIYYHKKYNVKIPIDFIDNMKKNNWQVPEISDENLEKYTEDILR